MSEQSLQVRYAPQNACFGCGAANEKGLRLQSFPRGDEVVAEFRPETWHEAFENILCGGIIGTLLDCHMNWTAAHHLMMRDGLDRTPVVLTASYRVEMRQPTPTGGPVALRARVTGSKGRRVEVTCDLIAGGEVTAVGEGTFVAVRGDHPARHGRRGRA
jgi:acyl-coenzyme A thioesterase PaaI-like protein